MKKYRIKNEVWAEQVPEKLDDILKLAEKWGASVTVHPEHGISLNLVDGGYSRGSASPGDWLIQSRQDGKGVLSDTNFTESFTLDE